MWMSVMGNRECHTHPHGSLLCMYLPPSLPPPWCPGLTVWVKTNQLQRLIRTGRTGHWINHSKEHCLVGVKGNPQVNKGVDCDVIVAEASGGRDFPLHCSMAQQQTSLSIISNTLRQCIRASGARGRCTA